MTQRPSPAAPQLSNSEESSGAEQVGAVQGEGDGAGAVVAGRDEGAVAAAVDVGQPDQLVAGPDDLLHRGRGAHRRGGEAFDVAGELARHEQLGLGRGDHADQAAAGDRVLRGRRGERLVGDDLAGRVLLVDRAVVDDAAGARVTGAAPGGTFGRARVGRAAGRRGPPDSAGVVVGAGIAAELRPFRLRRRCGAEDGRHHAEQNGAGCSETQRRTSFVGLRG